MSLSQLKWHMALLLSQHFKWTEIMTKSELYRKLNSEGWYWHPSRKAWLEIESEV